MEIEAKLLGVEALPRGFASFPSGFGINQMGFVPLPKVFKAFPVHYHRVRMVIGRCNGVVSGCY